MLRTLAVCCVLLASSLPARADLNLLMIDRPGCEWCIRWLAEVGPAYPMTAEGRAAPLMRARIGDVPDDIRLSRAARYTPTFVLLRDGAEVGRIEGYPGEDFFYGMLQRLIEAEGSPTN